MTNHPEFQDDAFDLRTRAELTLAFDPSQAPASLFKKEPSLLSRRGFQRGLAVLFVTGGTAGTVLAIRPPELVCSAIEHEYYERTLRGNFMDGRKILAHLGLGKSAEPPAPQAIAAIPGYPQLMRPCDIDGHLVYHLTTFFEKGGMVTVFAFDQPVLLPEGSGWWGNVYWQVVRSRDDQPLVMVAQKKKALAVAQATFGKPMN
jgi:hypothetical protein